MVSLGIVEAYATVDNLAHSQSKARKGKKYIIVKE
jgi:hypothetical protein